MEGRPHGGELGLGVVAGVLRALARSDHVVGAQAAWLPQLYASMLPALQQQRKEGEGVEALGRPADMQDTARMLEGRALEDLAWAVSRLVQAGAPVPPLPWLQASAGGCTHTHPCAHTHTYAGARAPARACMHAHVWTHLSGGQVCAPDAEGAPSE